MREGSYVTGLALKKYTMSLELSLGELNSALEERCNMCKDILEGVGFVHGIEIVHNGLNPRNIMIDDKGQAIIINFDSCTILGDHRK